MIRKALISEAKKIRDIITPFSLKGLLLPISLSEIYTQIRDFFVFVNCNSPYGDSFEDKDALLGVCALNIIWEDLAEIRSLAVKEEHWGKGIGSSLIKACLKEATHLGIKKIFCLTYNKEFFTSLGFKEIDKAKLPHKIWADCLKCSKFPDCTELALIFHI